MPAVAALAALPRAGENVDRYRIVAAIAQGGMAAVYAARREGPGGFDKLLALKVMLPHLAVERRFVQMFLDEARIVAQLQHANLAQVFDAGEHHGLPYLVMEFLNGKSLSECLRRASEQGLELPIEVIVTVLAEAAAGLHAAHEAVSANGSALGVVHRDVSPQNIHVGYDGHVKVVDFGIALAAGRVGLTRTGEVKGKLGYVAPEQLDQQHQVDRRADLWALGVMAWEVFAQRRLFHADTDSSTMWNVMQLPIPPLASVAPTVSPAVAQLIDQCLQRDVSRRPPTALVVSNVLRELVPPRSDLVRDWAERLFAMDRLSETELLKATPTSAIEPQTAVARAPRRLPLVIGGAIALVAAVGVGAVLLAAPKPVAMVPEAEAPVVAAAPVAAMAPLPAPMARLPAAPAPEPMKRSAVEPVVSKRSAHAAKAGRVVKISTAAPSTAPEPAPVNKAPLLRSPY